LVSNFLIADAVNRIKISILVRLSVLEVPNNKLINFVLKLLYDLGYVFKFIKVNFKKFRIWLKTKIQKNNIKQLFIISRPSARNYFDLKNLKGGELNNFIAISFLFVSTSEGLVTDLESTFLHIGGEPVLGIN